jgi:HEAT repeat protein
MGRPSLILSSLLLLLLLAAFFAQRRGESNNAGGLNHGSNRVTAEARKHTDAELELLLAGLSSADTDKREGAKKALIAQAKESEERRQAVVRALLERLDRPDVRSQLLYPSFSYLWASGAEVLCVLRASEAVDFLVRCIDCGAITEPASSTYHHRPAIRALIGMGRIAIPQLSQALYDSKQEVRFYTAFCLGNIGGGGVGVEETRAALVRALETETDPDVRVEIEASIATIDRWPK